MIITARRIRASSACPPNRIWARSSHRRALLHRSANRLLPGGSRYSGASATRRLPSRRQQPSDHPWFSRSRTRLLPFVRWPPPRPLAKGQGGVRRSPGATRTGSRARRRGSPARIVDAVLPPPMPAVLLLCRGCGRGTKRRWTHGGPVPTHSCTPAYAPRARSPYRLRRLLLLIRCGLLLVVGLCALTHGPTRDDHRPVSATTASAASAAGDAAPHGPHRHHENEECAPGGVVRTTTQAAEQPPADAGIPALAGSLAVLGVRPVPRHPYQRRRTRAGRTALARTSRWRI